MFDRMNFLRSWAALLGVSAWVILTGCRPSATDSIADGHSITNYQVKGVVKSLKPDEKEVVIKHEEIPGYMMAMTMPFSVRDTNELRGVKPGDSVEFRMRVTETDGWIDQLKVTASAAPTNTPPPKPAETNSPSGFRVLPTVPELQVGDLVPDYSFTNQFGAPIKLSQFRGQALAVTFIFTRCPFPLFCPRMSDAFSTAQKELLKRTSGPTNWQLLSISFDPEFDTPGIMKSYGQRWGADPQHWTLATGSFDQIEPLAVSVGLYFGRGVSIADQNHNLRTFIIGPTGHLVKLFPGNEWTGADLAEALLEAAPTK